MIIADLHLHSRFSRATSKDLTIPNLEKYARIKGLDVLGTGDFTHPEWLNELKKELAEDETGILKTKTGFNFVLQAEISNIYNQGNKLRKVHNVLLAKSFEVVDQINELLSKKGKLASDGRPIFGSYSCIELVDDLMKIDENIEIIPAHCLLPGTYIHSNPNPKKIEEIKRDDKVLTHDGIFQKVLKTYERFYKGRVYKIIPWYFREGLATTSEHPFYAIKSIKKCSWIKGICKPLCSQKEYCKKKFYKNYTLKWIQVKDLEKGDFIAYPRIKETLDRDKIKISDIVEDVALIKKRSRTKDIKNEIIIGKDFCRLAGYYIAEGYSIRDEAIGFSFNKKEKEYVQDVIHLMKVVFGIKPTKFDELKGIDIIFYSHILNRFFKKLFYADKEKRAWTKSVPEFMLFLPKEKQTELLRGWWRGDDGYTVSHNLANQMKVICIRLGIIPSISKDSAEKFNARGKHFINNRKIFTNKDTFIFSNLSFFEEKELLKDRSFRKFINKRNMKHGWVDKNYIYLPIRKIEVGNYEGNVYNLEVEKDNSYVAEFATVHNCWTPWFAIFGSMSGFDSVEECFMEKTKYIHALETGMSSDPAMNWRLSKLDKFSLISNSDSHSYWPWRIGREANVFDLKEPTYRNIINAIRTKQGFKETVEVDPGYGKYHFDGHRLCNVCMSPSESIKLKNICPKCGRKLTIGVAHRIEELADRPEGFVPKGAVPFKKLIPLSEIISAVIGSGIATAKTWKIFNDLIKQFGNEFNVLLNAEEKDLLKVVEENVAKAIIDNRNEKIKIQPGYDGEYGYPVFSEKGIKEKKEIKKVQKGLGDFIK